jgi:protoporphyrinogen oxidase
LLRGKFGPHAEAVSAAWFWSKLKLRGGSRGQGGEERLGYFRGGFAALADAIAGYVSRNGGEIRLGSAATGIEVAHGRISGVFIGAERLAVDAAIFTPAPPIIAGLLASHLPADYVSHLAAIDYLANICIVLELDHSLSGLYWMNVNDPSFPFVGVIEHTHLDQADPVARRHIVYLSRYLPASDGAYGESDAHLLAEALPHIRRMFPAFRDGWIRGVHVWRARYAQPIVVRGYASMIPAHRTPLAGAYIASMAQVYPEDRGTNYAIRDGRGVARAVAEWLRGEGSAGS